MDQKIIIESLAMDLKRIALGLNRGSVVMADRFKKEALARGEELDQKNISGYPKKLLESTRKALNSSNKGLAEDILMYSTLFQNYAQKNYIKVCPQGGSRTEDPIPLRDIRN